MVVPSRPVRSPHTTTAAPATGRRSRGRRHSTSALLVVAFAVLLAACGPWPVTVPNLNAADNAAAWLVTDDAANGSSATASQTVDLVIALAATGGDVTVANAALDRLAVLAPAYVRPGGAVDVLAAARVLLAFQMSRGAPPTIAGQTVEAHLRSTLASSGPDTGRFGSASPATQAWAMLALARTTAKVPAPAATWLAARACADGSFPGTSCPAADVEATALGASALKVAGGPAGVADAALAWLLANQGSGGGFGSPPAARASALAAQSLRQFGRTTEAESAATFVRSIQYPSSAGSKAGAIRTSASVDGDLRQATAWGALSFGAGPINEVAFARVTGSPCPDANGVTVVVDFARFDGTIHVACAVGPQATGWSALTSAGFTLESVPQFPNQAICTINGFPEAGFPECWWTGFWSYWHDAPRSGTWTFSDWGAPNRTPPPGSVEGWRYEPDLVNHVADPPGIPSV